MSWRLRVKLRKPADRPSILHLESGEHVLKIVDEPEEPISTRYGLRLPLIVKPIDSDDKFTWLIPFREEVGEESLLWQLKNIADKHNGLRGLKIKVTVSGKGGRKSYKIEELGA